MRVSSLNFVAAEQVKKTSEEGEKAEKATAVSERCDKKEKGSKQHGRCFEGEQGRLGDGIDFLRSTSVFPLR